jgi:hypothetical protein
MRAIGLYQEALRINHKSRQQKLSKAVPTKAPRPWFVVVLQWFLIPA